MTVQSTQVWIRADASFDMGVGHIMRCLTLAKELREQGAEVRFVARQLPGHLCDFVLEQGFEVFPLPWDGSKPEGWLGVSWEHDADQVLQLMQQQQLTIDWLIVDQYGLDRRWERRMRHQVRQIMVIDDTANREHDCDLLLDQNLFQAPEQRYRDLVPASCRLLLGPHYALLRREFREARARGSEEEGIKRWLVFFGGTDPTNETEKTLEALKSFNHVGWEIDVIVGGTNPRREQIRQNVATLPNARYHCQVSDMAAKMAAADVSIGAGGSATWERCCLGLPSIQIAVADNQVQVAKQVAELGASLYLGESPDVTVECIRQAIDNCVNNPQFVTEMSRRAREIVDGDGAMRVVQALQSDAWEQRTERARGLSATTDQVPLGFNILISSVSKKVPLIKAVQRACAKLGNKGLIYGGDVNPHCIGRYFVDQFWEMPRLSMLSTTDLLAYCKEHNIRAIIPTRDGELAYFAERKHALREHGILVMVSDLEVVDICMDKLLFAQKVAGVGLPAIPAYENLDELPDDLLVVKGRYGAGSHLLGLRLTREQAQEHAKLLEHPIFQPYVEGQEVSVDLYRDQNGITKGVIVRSRDLVVGGESQVTTTLRHEKVERLCAELAGSLDFYGHLVVQIMLDDTGEAHFIECNSRFGGASTLSVAAGLDSFYWFLLEASGADVQGHPFVRSTKELKQVRYAEDWVM